MAAMLTAAMVTAGVTSFAVRMGMVVTVNIGIPVKVLDTTSKWFGVTYSADRQAVVDKIQSLDVYKRQVWRRFHLEKKPAAF